MLPPQSPNRFLDTALEAYESGLAVLPCLDGQKTPHTELLPRDDQGLPVWAPLQTQRPSESQILTWGEQAPYANPAIICGLPSCINGNYLFVVDCDDLGLFRELRQEFKHLYGPTWAVDSYRGGHIYFLSPQPVKSRTGKFGGKDYEIKGQGTYVMAWGALHPEQFYYEFAAAPNEIAIVSQLAPLSPLKFLDASQLALMPPLTLQEARGGTAALQAKAWRIAREKAARQKRAIERRRPCYATRSEMDMAIILGCHNAGVPSEIVRHVLANLNVAEVETHFQRLVRERRQAAAEANFRTSWRKAQGRSDSKEAVRTMARMKNIRAWIEQQQFIGRRDRRHPDRLTLTDRAVLLAHVQRCEAVKKEVYGLDCRSGAEWANCSFKTFARSTRVLIAQGLVEVAKKSRKDRGLSNLYRLRAEGIVDDTLPHSSGRGSVSSTIRSVEHHVDSGQSQMSESGEGEALPTARPAAFDLDSVEDTHGVFGRGGFGVTGYAIYRALLNQHPNWLTQASLVAMTGLSRTTVRARLQKMEKAGFVWKKERCYQAIPHPDYQGTGEEQGTAFQLAERRARHQQDRRRHQYEVKALAERRDDTVHDDLSPRAE